MYWRGKEFCGPAGHDGSFRRPAPLSGLDAFEQALSTLAATLHANWSAGCSPGSQLIFAMIDGCEPKAAIRMTQQRLESGRRFVQAYWPENLGCAIARTWDLAKSYEAAASGCWNRSMLASPQAERDRRIGMNVRPRSDRLYSTLGGT